MLKNQESPLQTLSPGRAILFIRVVTSAAFDRVADDIFVDPKGVHRLKVSTTQPAHDGKANRGILAVLSKYLGVPKSLLSIKSGAAARSKTVLIDGASERQIQEIQILLNNRALS
jgi:uncharacterized protein YggU (UPF0235/DUF167 family)